MSATIALGRLHLMDKAGTVGTPPARPAATAPEAEATIDLVQKARGGDQQAVDDLFTRYEARLRRWAHGRLPRQARGAHDTQDLVQLTLMRVFKRLATFDPRHPGAFRDYVWTTMLNAVRDLARHHGRIGTAEDIDDHDLAAVTASPYEEAIGREAFEAYEAALDRLRPEEREAIIMRIELGLAHAEVALALGKPSAAAAHMLVSRALVRLAKEMAHVRPQR